MIQIETVLINSHCVLSDYLSEIIKDNSHYKLLAISNSESDVESIVRRLQPKLVIYVGDPDNKGIFRYFMKLKLDVTNKMFDTICLSSNPSVKVYQDALSCGVFDYILHPFIQNRLECSLRRYLNFKNLARARDSLKQRDVDEYLVRGHVYRGNKDLPKGIDIITLNKVREAFTDISTIHSALSVAKDKAISKTTARRYLEYAVQTGLLLTDVHYGNKGRPERLYKINPII